MRTIRLVGLTLALIACSSHATKAVAPTTPEHWDGTASAESAVSHVLLLSIDGFHASDLERYIVSFPDSTLARLANVGVRYQGAFAPFPSDSFPSVLGWATGGTPRSTGIFYDISYSRRLSPPGSDCSSRGTKVDFSDAADLDNDEADGGGGLNPERLPRDPDRGCALVYPHDYLRANTIFEVAQRAGLRTAWSDKHLSYEVLMGPSGAGVDDLFDPEVNAFGSVQEYDALKVKAILNEIGGRDHDGKAAAVPSLFGMNFQAVSMAQKSNGYLDAAGTPSPVLATAMADVDHALGSIVDALWNAKLWSSTLLLVTASHGQSPIDPSLLNRVSSSAIPKLVNEVAPDLLAAATQDTVALLWLTDASKADAVAEHLLEQKAAIGLDRVLVGDELAGMFGGPEHADRIPDLIAIVNDGTIYTNSGKKVAEHGGFSDDDRHVALLVSGASAGARQVSERVETRQLAPTLLSALGLDPAQLSAVQNEATSVLPGLVLKR
jgi:hypothetical protein